MKQLTRITLVLITAVMFASVSYGNHKVNQFGLSDSCWQVFLSQLPGGDSSLGAHYAELDALDAQIDSMMKLIPGLRGKAVKELQKKIIALRKERNDLKKEVHAILAANMTLLIQVQNTCGLGEDTTITDTTDTTGGGGTDTLSIGLNPNPLFIGGSVNVSFALDAPGNVTVNVFSQTTATLVQSFSFPGLPAGPQSLLLNLGALPSGSYIIQVQTGTATGTATLQIL